MKNIFYLIITFVVLVSCKKETDFVTFSGKVENKKTDSLIIFHPKANFKKVIKLNSDGTFKDTLKVVNGMFSMTDGRDFTLLYLMNGDNLIMNYDANKFDESLQFTGKYSLENEFLKTSIINENALFSNTGLMKLQKDDFDNTITNYVTNFNTRLNSMQLDSEFLNYQKKEILNFKDYLEKDYLEKNYNTLFLAKGKPSPKFVDYEDFKGGNTSLEDLKGKYVYIDVWATWCQPCKVEIPYLQKIEKEFHGKNIEFVSVSIDDKRGYNTWKSMVVDKKLGGTQLYAKGDRSFSSQYRIKSIPRFILIDDKGNIVDANAPRPSSPKLKELFNSLDI